MVYTYEGDGTIKVQGSAKVWRKIYYYYEYQKYKIAKNQPKFKGNDAVYEKKAARKGILKKVIIDQIILNNNKKTYYKDATIYQDILNSLYMEEELITLEEAKAIALEYLLAKRQQLIDIIDQLDGNSD